MIKSTFGGFIPPANVIPYKDTTVAQALDNSPILKYSEVNTLASQNMFYKVAGITLVGSNKSSTKTFLVQRVVIENTGTASTTKPIQFGILTCSVNNKAIGGTPEVAIRWDIAYGFDSNDFALYYSNNGTQVDYQLLFKGRLSNDRVTFEPLSQRDNTAGILAGTLWNIYSTPIAQVEPAGYTKVLSTIARLTEPFNSISTAEWPNGQNDANNTLLSNNQAYFATTATLNTPVPGSPGILVQYNMSNGHKIQVFYLESSKVTLYQRQYNNLGGSNAWTTWGRFLRSDEIPPISESFSIVSGFLSATGWSSGGYQSVPITLPTRFIGMIGIGHDAGTTEYEAARKAILQPFDLGTSYIDFMCLGVVPQVRIPFYVMYQELASVPSGTPARRVINCFPESSGGSASDWINPEPNVNGTWYRGTIASTGTERVNYSGYLYATRVYNSFYSDYAEHFKSNEILEPGDVVALSPTGKETYVKATQNRADLVIGVVSDEYAHCIGVPEKEETLNPIGMAGRVNVKVVGKVNYGDLLTISEIPGVARAILKENYKVGTVIGKALESRSENGINKIRMIIMLC